MKPTEKELFRTNNFDLIRLLAAAQVVFGHATDHLHIRSCLLSNIWDYFLKFFPGVPIFFVLSGFLISRSFETNSNIIDYAWNRSLRIFPALWGCFIISVISFLIAGYRPSCSTTEFFAWTMAQMSFVQIYNPDFMRDYGVGGLNGSLWTIPVEMQFYVTIPIVYISLGLLKAKKTVALLVTILAFFALGIVSESTDYPHPVMGRLLHYSFVPYLYMFLIGVLVQRNFTRLRTWLEGRGVYWLVGYGVCVSILSWIGLPCDGNNVNVVSVVILAFTTISTAFTFPAISQRLLRRNDLSYGLYIYHMPVVNFLLYRKWLRVEVPESDDLVGSPLLLVVAGCGALALAFASWNIVEKPAMRHKRRPFRVDGGVTP